MQSLPSRSSGVGRVAERATAEHADWRVLGAFLVGVVMIVAVACVLTWMWAKDASPDGWSAPQAQEVAR